MSLAKWNIYQWRKKGGISKLLLNVYIWAIILMIMSIYSILVYNTDSKFAKNLASLVIFLRILYGNAYIFSMVEMYQAI